MAHFMFEPGEFPLDEFTRRVEKEHWFEAKRFPGKIEFQHPKGRTITALIRRDAKGVYWVYDKKWGSDSQ
jgi:hypothetical protein